ncbi:MAG: apolipoprotein N-acyltransferase [Akkermansia sp.]
MSSQTRTDAVPQVGSLKRWQALLLSLLGGAIMALAFLPYDYSALVWVGLLPLLTVLWLRPRNFWGSFGYGWLYGMGWYCVSFWWIHEVGDVFQIPMPLFLGIAFFPLMSLYALLPALWAGVAATWLRPRLEAVPQLPSDASFEDKRSEWREWAYRDLFSTLRCAFGLGALWVCVEWLRAHGTLGFSWNSMGMALYDGLSLVQWAEFVGTSALSFLPVFIAVIIWCACRRCFKHFKGMGKGVRPMDFYAAVLAIFALLMGGLSLSQRYSALQIAQKEGAISLPVLAVQTNLGQKERIAMRGEERTVLYNRYLNATGFAFQEIQKDTVKLAMKSEEVGITQQLPLWVIWPESALAQPLWRNKTTGEGLADGYTQDIFFNEQTGLPALRRMVREMGGADFVLFTGADELLVHRSPVGGVAVDGMYNALAIFEGGLDSLQTANKQHLMPFGEYVPLTESIEWIGEMYSEITGTQVGEGIQRGVGDEPIPVRVPGTDTVLGVIPAICYEDTVGDLLTKFVREGPQIIVNVSNDAWFQHSACGEQQARAAAFRCIELRRPMVRAANQGLTCSIAANGAPIDELRRGDGRPWRDGYSYSVIPIDPQAGMTLYARFGDWAVVLCAILALVLSLAGVTLKGTLQN